MAFVQNSLLNLPGMSDGSITIIDLVKGEAIGSIKTLHEQGFNPNSHRAAAAMESSCGALVSLGQIRRGSSRTLLLPFPCRGFALCSTPRARKILVIASLIS